MKERDRTIVFADLSGFAAPTEARGDGAAAAIALRLHAYFDASMRARGGIKEE